MASIRRFNPIIAQLFYVNWILLVFSVATTQKIRAVGVVLFPNIKPIRLRLKDTTKFNQSQAPAWPNYAHD